MSAWWSSIGPVVSSEGCRPPSALSEYSWLSWSPDGRSLAYQTGAPSGTSLAVWREAGQTLVRTAPDNRAAFGYCLWVTGRVRHPVPDIAVRPQRLGPGRRRRR